MKYLAPILVLIGLIWSFHSAPAHDVHHPENNDWYMSLRVPGSTRSCCGLADAYWADKVEVRNGETWVMIQDERDDQLLGRPHIPSGTWVKVPNEKLIDEKQMRERGNPTGHGVVFIGHGNVDTVYCYVFATLS